MINSFSLKGNGVGVFVTFSVICEMFDASGNSVMNGVSSLKVVV